MCWGGQIFFLKLEIIKKILALPIIFIAVFLGIKIMIIGMLINSVIAYFINSYYSGKHIGYSSAHQVRDILPSFFLAGFIGMILYIVGNLLHVSDIIKLIILILLGLCIFIATSEIMKIEAYSYIKETFYKNYLFWKRR